jgi:hypothetical protein
LSAQNIAHQFLFVIFLGLTLSLTLSGLTLSRAAFGLPPFLLVEQTCEHAASGFLTHFRRGWCHTPFLLFNQSL